VVVLFILMYRRMILPNTKKSSQGGTDKTVPPLSILVALVYVNAKMNACGGIDNTHIYG